MSRQWFTPRLEIVPIFVLPTQVLVMILATPWIGRRAVGRWLNAGRIRRADRGPGGAHLDVVGKPVCGTTATSNRWPRPTGRPSGSSSTHPAGPSYRPPEIPPAGVPARVRRDARAVELFATCVTCHEYADGRGTFSRPAGAKPTAPDLNHFASRPWLAAFLEKKQIAGLRFFGNTKFRRAEMPSFVKDTLSKLDDRGRAELQDLMAAFGRGRLAVAAGHGRPRCPEDQGRPGGLARWAAPIATSSARRGNRTPPLYRRRFESWLVGIISNPAHGQFDHK